MTAVMWISYKAILIAVVMGISLGIAAYSTWWERRFAAFLQDRLGPNRFGFFGLLQPAADGIKLFFKEEFFPAAADKFLYILGPSIAMMVALSTSAVIPWGGILIFNGVEYSLQVADINAGILYVFAVVSVGVYGIMIGGWASNNKYGLLGAIRASSQMISYELAMGLSIAALVMQTGTLSLKSIVEMQAGLNWNVFSQPLGFLVFMVCAFAECNRAPFDLPECETELVGGYHTEYSSMKLGFYLFAEYINMFVSSAIMATLYFGGSQLPFGEFLNLDSNLITLLGTGFFFVKIVAFIILFMWVRWTLPRFRYDQLMKLGWTVLLPLAVVNVLITGFMILAGQGGLPWFN